MGWNEMRWDWIGMDEMRWDWIGLDGLRWYGTGWDVIRMKWDRTGWNIIVERGLRKRKSLIFKVEDLDFISSFTDDIITWYILFLCWLHLIDPLILFLWLVLQFKFIVLLVSSNSFLSFLFVSLLFLFFPLLFLPFFCLLSFFLSFSFFFSFLCFALLCLALLCFALLLPNFSDF